VSSTDLEIVKHAEHALSRKDPSRTEISGSRRTRRVPAATGSVTANPLPDGEFGGASTFSREPSNLVAVVVVTDEGSICAG
jgi:hypothetical protein